MKNIMETKPVSLLILGLISSIMLFSCDSNEEELSRFEFGLNSSDPLFLITETAEGALVEYFGGRNESGVPTKINSVSITERGAAEPSIVQLDESNRLSRIFMPDRSSFEFSWTSNHEVRISAQSSDGDIQVTVPFELNSLKNSSQNSNNIYNLGSIHEATARGGIRSDVRVDPINCDMMRNGGAQSSQQGIATIVVEYCAERQDDAMVILDVNDQNGNFYRGIPGEKIAGDLYAGIYRVDIPQVGARSIPFTEACESGAEAISNMCISLLLVPIGSENRICSEIGAAVDILFGGPTGEGVIVFADCMAAFRIARIICTAISVTPEPIGTQNLIDILCGKVRAIEDNFPTSYRLTPRAYILGIGSFEGETLPASTSGPFPNLRVEAEGELAFNNFQTQPEDPDPEQGYVATVLVNCPTEETEVTISIVGTDGYQDSRIVTISQSSSVSLSVPGAGAGVMDVISVEANDINLSIAIVF